MTEQKIWRDGKLVEWQDATIHVISHVVHYGSSVFEGLRTYDTPKGPAIFRAQDHMRRFLDSCKIYRMPMAYSVNDLVQACSDTVRANGLGACYLRPFAIRTGDDIGVYPIGIPVETFVIAKVWGTYLGEDGIVNGVDVKVSSWNRVAPNTLPALAKAGGNYLSAQLSKMEAKLDGYSEGILLDTSGHVAEGSGENLFVVRDGTIYTAPLGSSILNGITRDSVRKIAEDLGIKVVEQTIPREMLYLADELFFTGTAAEITPIRSVDRIEVGAGGRGPVTARIQEEFMGIAKGRIPDRHGWLTLVT